MYIRSVNGTTAAWYRGVQTRHAGALSAGRLQREVAFVEAGDGSGLDDALDAANREKYGRSSSAVARITADVARATTLCASTPFDHLTADHLNDEKDAKWIRTPALPP